MRFISAIVLLFIVPALYAQRISNESFQQINSNHDERSPVLSPDGKILYFTIANHAQNVGGQRDPGDIWFSQLIGDQWSAPIHAGNVLNDRAYNAVAGISADGNSLFLLSHYDASG